MTNKFTMTVIVVEGHGQFPVDMLRYDCCVPASQGDVSQMMFARSASPRRVSLKMFTPVGMVVGATDGRWQSFGWSVVDGPVRS